MRILIVEDDEVLRDGLSRSMRQSGYAVDRVGTGDRGGGENQRLPRLRRRITQDRKVIFHEHILCKNNYSFF